MEALRALCSDQTNSTAASAQCRSETASPSPTVSQQACADEAEHAQLMRASLVADDGDTEPAANPGISTSRHRPSWSPGAALTVALAAAASFSTAAPEPHGASEQQTGAVVAGDSPLQPAVPVAHREQDGLVRLAAQDSSEVGDEPAVVSASPVGQQHGPPLQPDPPRAMQHASALASPLQSGRRGRHRRTVEARSSQHNSEPGQDAPDRLAERSHAGSLARVSDTPPDQRPRSVFYRLGESNLRRTAQPAELISEAQQQPGRPSQTAAPSLPGRKAAANHVLHHRSSSSSGGDFVPIRRPLRSSQPTGPQLQRTHSGSEGLVGEGPAPSRSAAATLGAATAALARRIAGDVIAGHGSAVAAGQAAAAWGGANRVAAARAPYREDIEAARPPVADAADSSENVVLESSPDPEPSLAAERDQSDDGRGMAAAVGNVSDTTADHAPLQVHMDTTDEESDLILLPPPPPQPHTIVDLTSLVCWLAALCFACVGYAYRSKGCVFVATSIVLDQSCIQFTTSLLPVVAGVSLCLLMLCRAATRTCRCGTSVVLLSRMRAKCACSSPLHVNARLIRCCCCSKQPHPAKFIRFCTW